MVLYIWLLWYQIIIYCAQGAGCIQSSMAHFEYILGIGAVELIFEISGIVKVFLRKDMTKEWPKPEGKNGVVNHTVTPKREKDDV